MIGDDEELPPERPGDADAALAGEYVLRLLGPEDTAACAEREANDPAFAALVAAWRADLGGLDGAFAPVAPPARLRNRVEARLFGREPSGLARLWQSAGLWRGLAVAGALAALYFGTLTRVPVTPPGEAPARLVTALASQPDSDVSLLAWFEPQAAVLNINRSGEVPPGRELQLWMIEGEGATPVSLGVLPDVERARVPLTREQADRIGPGVTLAVTAEPPGGSPTPTPPILAAGAVSEL